MMLGTTNIKFMYSYIFCLTSTLVVNGWSTSRPYGLPPVKPGTHCIGSWVGLMTGLAGSENLAPPVFDPRTVQPVKRCYTDRAIPVHINKIQ